MNEHTGELGNAGKFSYKRQDKQLSIALLTTKKERHKALSAESLSRVQLFATPWTVALQAPLSLLFSRQEYWSGLPRSPPGDLPKPGIHVSQRSLHHYLQ